MKKRNKLLRIILITLLILSLPIFVLSYFGSQTRQLHKAEYFFKNNQPVLEQSIDILESTLENVLTEDPVNNEDNFIHLKKPSILPSGIDQIYWVRAYGDNQAYVLCLGGFGIVPACCYYGLYYSINDTPCNLMKPQAPETLKQQENNLKAKNIEIWTWQQRSGDNSFYTKRIAPHWFTYRETF